MHEFIPNNFRKDIVTSPGIAIMLGDAIRANTTLAILSLSCNYTTVLRYADMLTYLRIVSASEEADGLQAIVEGLKQNFTLQELDLSSSRLTNVIFDLS